MTDKVRERIFRYLYLGLTCRDAWAAAQDEGLWKAWKTLKLETPYLISVELARMKHERECDEELIGQWIN